MRHLWRRMQRARLDRTWRTVAGIGDWLNDVLRSDDLESDDSRQAEALQPTFGRHFEEMIDFQALSRTLCGGRRSERMPAKRRKRIEWALQVLREQKFFAIEADSEAYEFVFASCTEALAQFKDRLPRMAELSKAIRIAALELENRYRDEIHDDFFGVSMPAHSQRKIFGGFPAILCRSAEQDCSATDRANLIEILSSDLPMKLVLQVDHLFHNSKGQPANPVDRLGAHLAGMAMNLGSAFVLQTATSNLCPMARRLADGLAAPGPALFCLFSPGKDSHPGLPPYLAAAAAIESRLFPTLVFDPDKGGAMAECFSLEGNPQPGRDWPVHAFTYEDGKMRSVTENCRLPQSIFWPPIPASPTPSSPRCRATRVRK